MSTAARVVVIAVLAAVIVYVLFTVVFPWVDRTFVTDPVLDAAPSPTTVA